MIVESVSAEQVLGLSITTRSRQGSYAESARPQCAIMRAERRLDRRVSNAALR